MAGDVRPLSPAERAWGMYRQLPAAVREQMQQDLRDLLRS